MQNGAQPAVVMTTCSSTQHKPGPAVATDIHSGMPDLSSDPLSADLGSLLKHPQAWHHFDPPRYTSKTLLDSRYSPGNFWGANRLHHPTIATAASSNAGSKHIPAAFAFCVTNRHDVGLRNLKLIPSANLNDQFHRMWMFQFQVGIVSWIHYSVEGCPLYIEDVKYNNLPLTTLLALNRHRLRCWAIAPTRWGTWYRSFQLS